MKDSSFTQREVHIHAYIHVTFMYVWCVLTELRLVVLGQASAACTMLGLQEKQDGKSAPAKYTKEVAGKKAIDSDSLCLCLSVFLSVSLSLCLS